MKTKTVTPHLLQQFNQYAIAHRFTGIQMQLWQHLYWLVYTYGQGVCIPTYHLLETMQISRSQLLRARNTLVQAGCLRIDKVNNQRLHYTLLLDGVPVDTATNEPLTPKKPVGGNVSVPRSVLGDHTVSVLRSVSGDHTHNNVTDYQNTTPLPKQKTTPTQKIMPTQKPKKSIPTGVAKEPNLTDCEMELQLNAFADSVENRNGAHAEHHREALRQALFAWYRMRSKYHWHLTRTGLNHLLLTLLEVGEGDLFIMTKVVNKSVAECWKGFYPYQEKQIKSGAPLRKQEEMIRKAKEKQEREKEKEREQTRYRNGHIAYYDTKYEDFSFLEW